MPSPSADIRPIADADVGTTERPLLTWVDDVTGERVDLSASELWRKAAQTTHLLRGECGLRAGDRLAALLPPHWQTAAVLLGAWFAGITVSYRPWATAGLPHPDDVPATPFDAVVVSRERLRSWLEKVPEARHRFVVDLDGAGLADVPPDYRDFVAAVAAMPELPPAREPRRRTDAASPDGISYQQWGELARGVADKLGLCEGDRVLVDVSRTEQPVMWLLAPLSVGASIVLCANLDRSALDERKASEGATHVL